MSASWQCRPISGYDGGTDFDGNAIFVFGWRLSSPISAICTIRWSPGHLGRSAGSTSMLFPVYGSYTLDQAGNMEVLKSIRRGW